MRDVLLHLRLPFVFVLAPIYVWGAYAVPGWDARTTLAFLLVHLALYPGANAYNTAYDRDTGPIGGLARPPSIPHGLAVGSTALQAAGAALAALIGWEFLLAYLALWAIFSVYSHPRTRWKRSPWISTPAIVIGQGGIGWFLGWSAAGGEWPPDARAGWSLAAACAAVTAFFPFTQIYQREADAARRDRTLAAALGVRGTFFLGAAAFLVIAACGVALELPGLTAYSLIVGLTAVGMAIAGRAPSHGRVMTVSYANSALLLAYMIVTWP
jgi:1,4-dihydroxy-2-naphthoate octaprenyltransferase